MSSRQAAWPLRAVGGVPVGLSSRHVHVLKSNSCRSARGRLSPSVPPKMIMPSGAPACSKSGTTVAVCSVRAGGTVSRSPYTTASHRGTVLLPLPRWSRDMSRLRTLDALSPPKR